MAKVKSEDVIMNDVNKIMRGRSKFKDEKAYYRERRKVCPHNKFFEKQVMVKGVPSKVEKFCLFCGKLLTVEDKINDRMAVLDRKFSPEKEKDDNGQGDGRNRSS